MDLPALERSFSIDDIERHCPAALWAVEERTWHQIAPDLPDDVAALLAPPVVVTAFS